MKKKKIDLNKFSHEELLEMKSICKKRQRNLGITGLVVVGLGIVGVITNLFLGSIPLLVASLALLCSGAIINIPIDLYFSKMEKIEKTIKNKNEEEYRKAVEMVKKCDSKTSVEQIETNESTKDYEDIYEASDDNSLEI